MERRNFLKLAFGVAAGAGVMAVAGSAVAAPLMAPTDFKGLTPGLNPQPEVEAKPAIATEQDIDEATAEQVQYYGYRRRFYRPRYYRPRYYRPRYYRRRRSFYY